MSNFPYQLTRCRHFSLRILAGSLVLLTPQSAQSRAVSIPFNPANFSHPLTINNPLFPLVVGQTLIYRSEVGGGARKIMSR